MKQKNYKIKKLNLKKKINKRKPKVQKIKRKFVIQKKFTPSTIPCCLNQNVKETLSHAFKEKMILERKAKYKNLFVKGYYFRNDENLKDDAYERKI